MMDEFSLATISEMTEMDRARWMERVKEIVRAVNTVPEAKELRDQAVTVLTYLRQQRDASDDAIDGLKEAKIRVERRLGKILEGTNPPGNPQLYPEGTIGPSLAEQEISRKHSAAWKTLAEPEEDEFDELIEDAKADRQLNTSRLVGRIKERDSSPLPGQTSFLDDDDDDESPWPTERPAVAPRMPIVVRGDMPAFPRGGPYRPCYQNWISSLLQIIVEVKEFDGIEGSVSGLGADEKRLLRNHLVNFCDHAKQWISFIEEGDAQELGTEA